MNICPICQQNLGNVHPKNKKIVVCYHNFSGKKGYNLAYYAHRLCIEDFDFA